MHDGSSTGAEPTIPPASLGFLLELAGAAQKAALYPPGHPLVATLGARLSLLVKEAAGEDGVLPVAVAGTRFVVDGALSSESRLLRDLARRFRRQGVGAVSFQSVVSPGEFQGLLSLLASEERRDGSSPPRLDAPHLRLQVLDFDHLSLVAEDAGDPDDRLSRIWRELAQAALASTPREEADIDPRAVARGISTHPGEPSHDRVLMGYLRRLAFELKDSAGSEASAQMGERLSRLLSELDERTMRRLFRSVRDPTERVAVVVDAGHVLGAETLLKVLRASLVEGDGESRLSPPLVRALTKLSLHARGGVPGIRAPAEEAIRGALARLLEGGDLSEDPNPAHYRMVLDRLAKEDPGEGLQVQRDPDGDRIRILQMSLETGSWGAMPRQALEVLLDNGAVVALARLLAGTVRGDPVAARIEERLVHPQRIHELTRGDELDEAALEMLVARLGGRAIDPLLDALALSGSRATRRKLFDCLRSLGEQASIRALQRMDDLRWYVLRNRLALASGLSDLPGGFDPMVYLRHGDPRVRREAVALAAGVPDRRLRALQLALEDADERVLQRALVAMWEGTPPELVKVVESRILERPVEEGLKVSAVRALGTSSVPEARETLLKLVVRKGFLGRTTLRPPSPVQREALAVLARRWAGSPMVDPVLAMARASRDPGVRAAVGGAA